MTQKLKEMARRNTPGTEETAKASNEKAIRKAREKGQALARVAGLKSGKWDRHIASGQASKEWREVLGRGGIVPSPFMTDGAVGENDSFSLSAVREKLRLVAAGGAGAGIAGVGVESADEEVVVAAVAQASARA